jgi:hypothetical protein
MLQVFHKQAREVGVGKVVPAGTAVPTCVGSKVDTAAAGGAGPVDATTAARGGNSSSSARASAAAARSQAQQHTAGGQQLHGTIHTSD